MNHRAHVLFSSEVHRPDTIAAHEQAAEKVIRHMKENLIEWDVDLSLKALARQGCYSASHLIHVFEEVTGTTPHHFLASLRMQKAKELLLDSEISVTEIALQVGYQSFPTFSRTFTDYVGISPSAFRRMPRTIPFSRVTTAAGDFIARSISALSGETIEGRTHLPPDVAGVVFVGTFTRGVPQGRPDSGTVQLQAGQFRIARPAHDDFHLMAALITFPTSGAPMAHSFLPTMVSSNRIRRFEPKHFDLYLRSVRATDPPLVVSLSGLLTLH